MDLNFVDNSISAVHVQRPKLRPRVLVPTMEEISTELLYLLRLEQIVRPHNQNENNNPFEPNYKLTTIDVVNYVLKHFRELNKAKKIVPMRPPVTYNSARQMPSETLVIGLVILALCGLLLLLILLN